MPGTKAGRSTERAEKYVKKMKKDFWPGSQSWTEKERYLRHCSFEKAVHVIKAG